MSAKKATTALEKYIKMLRRLGFKKALEIPFEMPGHGSVRNEKFFVFYQPKDAILCRFDTYLGSQVRDGSYYFNWKRRIPEDEVYARLGTFNGHWSMHGRRNVLVGYDYIMRFDHVREMIAKFKKCGEFVFPWIEKPHVRLIHYGDPVNTHEKAHAERVMMLPPSIRQMFLL